MSNVYTIDELISGYYEKQFSEAAEIAVPKFSPRHKMKMNKIFNLFSQNTRKTASNTLEKCYRPHSISKRLMIAAIIIICLVMMTGFVLLFISKGFVGDVYHNNTHIFAVDVSDCPSTIEKVYTLSVVPEGYELYESKENSFKVYNLYKDNAGIEFIFQQAVKSEFKPHINTEGYTLQETDVNGCNAVCIEFNNEAGTSSLVIWDNSKYILSLEGNFTKEDIKNLAIINEVNGF